MSTRGTGWPKQSEEGGGHDEDPSLAERDQTVYSVKVAVFIGALLALGAFGLYGTRTAYSVSIGAAIAVTNLLVMRAIIRGLIPAPEPEDAPRDGWGEETGDAGDAAPPTTWERAQVGWVIVACVKLLVLIGGLWFLLRRELVDPMPLIIGYSVLPLGITAGAMWPSRRK